MVEVKESKGHVAEAELLKMQKGGQFPDEPVYKSRTNSLLNVLETTGIKETDVGGLLL